MSFSLPYFGQERKLQDLEVELAARTKDVKARLAQLDAQVREAEAGSTLPWGGGLSTEGRLYLSPGVCSQPRACLPPGREQAEREAAAYGCAEAGCSGEGGLSAHLFSCLSPAICSPVLSGSLGF